MQTLQSSINTVKASIPKEQPKGVEAKKSFHDVEREKKSKDPDNKPYQEAMAAGFINAKEFMGTVLNSKHPKHDEALSLFKTKYDMDSTKVETDFVKQECERKNVAPYEMGDPAYESNVFKKYYPQGNITHEKKAMIDNFKSFLEDKWRERGYKSDRAFVESVASKYALAANDTNIELRNIKLKE